MTNFLINPAMKTILSISTLALFAGAAMAETVNIVASDLTETGVNYIPIEENANIEVFIDGLKETSEATKVARIYLGKDTLGSGTRAYGDIKVSLSNLGVTDRISFVRSDGEAEMTAGKLSYEVADSVSSSTFYLGGQVWNGTRYTLDSVDAVFNGRNTAHATAGVMTGSDGAAACEVTVNNGIRFIMDGENAYVRWMYVGGYNQSGSVMTINGGTYATLSAGSIGGNGTGTLSGGVYNYNGAVSHINGGTHVKITGGGHGDVYGGSQVDKSSTSYIDSTEIDISGGSANWVFGGSSLYKEGNNKSYIGGGAGSTAVSISVGEGATVATIVGGDYGEGLPGDSGNISGNILINIAGGTVTDGIYGASYGSGTSVDGNVGISLSGGKVSGDIYGGGYGNGSALKGNVEVGVSGNADLSQAAIYGGGANGATVSGTKTLNVGAADSAYAGAGISKVSGFDSVNVLGGSTVELGTLENSTLYVKENSVLNLGAVKFDLSGSVKGSRLNVAEGSKISVSGDIENNFNGVSNSGSLVAGLTGGDAVVSGTVKTVVDGADTDIYALYAGNGGNQKDSGASAVGVSKVGAVDLTVNNGRIFNIMASGAMYSDVVGDVNVKVNGGNIGAVYGAASNANVGGNVNITVSGGILTGEDWGKYGNVAIMAGGATNAGSSADSSTISGGTNILIAGNADVRGDVYGGGWGGYYGSGRGGRILGDVNVTVAGGASVSGTIRGGGIGGGTDIVGSRIFNVGTADSAYSGGVLKVADFSHINVNSGSAEFAEYSQASDGTLITIAQSASLSLVLGADASQLSNTTVANGGSFSVKRGSLADGASAALAGYSGSGSVEAFGGIFSGGVFTAGKSADISSGPVTVGTGDSDVHSVSFAADENKSLSLDFNVAGMGEGAVSVNSISEASDVSGIDGEVKAAYSVAADYDGQISVVFSAYIGEAEVANLLAWHREDGGEWELYDAEIQYKDGIASFIVDGFSSYAISQVPEPAAAAAIFGALALLVFARKRR